MEDNDDVAMDTEDMEIEEEPAKRPTEIRVRKDYVKQSEPHDILKLQPVKIEK